MKKVLFFILVGLSLVQTACNINAEEGMMKILSSDKPPVGVVFEVASGDENGWKWAVPLVKSYARQLREKFPKIKLAVVSHGAEQFQLTKGNRQYYPNAHKQVASLVKDQGIDVHVCGNFASSFGINKDDFVDFIDVASRGPAQVNFYENAGYVVLFVRQITAEE